MAGFGNTEPGLLYVNFPAVKCLIQEVICPPGNTLFKGGNSYKIICELLNKRFSQDIGGGNCGGMAGYRILSFKDVRSSFTSDVFF